LLHHFVETPDMDESYADKESQTGQRKRDHIQINLHEDVAHQFGTGLETYRFTHQALPEIDLDQVQLSINLLNRTLKVPLLISSMTGGTAEARQINVRLAEAAQATGIAMGLGSLRAALEEPELAKTYQVRSWAPDILLLANLGAVQLNYGYNETQCRRAVEMVEADGLILHLNPLQEALQPEGDTRWSGLLSKIEGICRALLPVPVIAKEVGWGISGETARRLADAGVAAIDVAGAGGTSWSQVEMYRTQDESGRRVAALFRDWGIPTAESLQSIRGAVPHLPAIASGGLRNGVDVAKVLALGASGAGMAGPFLKAATISAQAVVDVVEEVSRTLRIVMFAAGAKDIAALQSTPLAKRNHP
jgi:isopentenyl-diphosphate delta-isomerase